jgi:hypothetical protein
MQTRVQAGINSTPDAQKTQFICQIQGARRG